MSSYPDSPEGVAFALMEKIAATEPAQHCSEAAILALYQRCASVVNGDRPTSTEAWREAQKWMQ